MKIFPYKGIDDNVVLYQANLINFKENLKEDIKQNQMTDDITIERDVPTETPSNVNITEEELEANLIPNLHHKPELTFYLTTPGEGVDMQYIEELRVMKIKAHVNFNEKFFFPNFFFTDFWCMLADLKPIYKHQNTLQLNVQIRSLSGFWYKLLKGMEVNSEMMETQFGLPSSKDKIVEILKNNTTFYLVILFTVNILHTLFSFLSFTYDISYHANLKKLDGVFTKCLFFNIFHKLIAMIYVYMENANFIVKVELGIAVAIELWKARKIFDFGFTTKFPFINIKNKLTYSVEESKDYESEAIRSTMKYIFIPIAVLYFIYRFYYYKHKLLYGLFKFSIEYVFFLFNLFGFVLMTPQIYLNYKLKSVEHMPFKVLTFNFLNTIIDDLFVFAVKTPTMYRISCFKDDVIFVIFIYQLIAYRKNKRVVTEEIEAPKEEETKKLVGEEEVKKLADEKKNN
jgi:hypothetical protein